MNYLALSGNMHSLRRYFNSRVTCLDAPTWGRLSWSRRHAIKVAESITEPTVLIGFSAGATAALQIAAMTGLVYKTYAHSPMFAGYDFPKSHVVLFQTEGDSTPTYDATQRTVNQWESFGISNFWFEKDLPPVEPEPVRDFATWVMKRNNHQFRNCLPFLPPEIVR